MESRIREDFACRIGNPELWNCFFPFFSVFLFTIYSFFWDFWDQDKHAILTSRFDNAFKYFQFAQPVRDPQFKVRSPMVYLYGCNQHGTYSGLPNKRSRKWCIASDFFSKGKRDFDTCKTGGLKWPCIL